MSVEIQHPPNGIPTLDDLLNGGIKHDVEADPMFVWDKGVFLNELQKQDLVLSTSSDGAVDGNLAANAGLRQGTYKGTRMALTELYSLVEEAYSHPPALQILRSTDSSLGTRLILMQKAWNQSFPSGDLSNRRKMYTNGAIHW